MQLRYFRALGLGGGVRENIGQGVIMTVQRVITLAVLLTIVLFCSSVTWGQSMLPEAPAPQFWTHQAISEYVVLAGAIAVDAIGTQYGLSQGSHELNPVAAPFVQRGAPGQALASALALGSAVGVSYALHRTGHDRAAAIARHLAVMAECGAASFTFVRSFHTQGGFTSWQQQH